MALTKVMAKTFGGRAPEYGEIDKIPTSNVDGTAVSATRVESQSSSRRYTHLDYPGEGDYARELIAGAAQMDAAILVVSVSEGPTAQTREHVLLAREVAVPSIVVFLNKADLVGDADLVGLVELEVRELLSAYKFPGDKTPVVIGSALKALEGESSDIGMRAVATLVEMMDQLIPVPERDDATVGPLLTPLFCSYVRQRGAAGGSARLSLSRLTGFNGLAHDLYFLPPHVEPTINRKRLAVVFGHAC